MAMTTHQGAEGDAADAGGDGGGPVAEGAPEDVAATKESPTGQYLKELLGRRARIGKQAAE